MDLLKKSSPYAAGIVSLTVLAATLRSFLNHEMGSLALMVAGQMATLATLFVPLVLSEMRDREVLSVYRSMYLGR